MGSKEIFELRRAGQSAEGLRMARAEFQPGMDDVWFLRAYAWCLYDAAKPFAEAGDGGPGGARELNGQFTPLMREFARMGDPLRKDMSFSCMLRLAGKVARDWPEFLAFAKWSGVDDFEGKDCLPEQTPSGKTIDSVQKRYIRAICRETANRAGRSDTRTELIDWGASILEKALEQDPRDPWLPYYHVKVLRARGEVDRAVGQMSRVLRRQPKAAWAWVQMGEILEANQPEAALVCYARATETASEEQELAKARIVLARMLAEGGKHPEAADQVSRALKYREQNGYSRIPPDLQALRESAWYGEAIAGGLLRPLASMESRATAFLKALESQHLEYELGVVDHINAEKSITFIATGVDDGAVLPHGKFPDAARLAPGTVVEIGRTGPGDPPSGWRPAEDRTISGLCETFKGTLSKNPDQDFAFVRSGKGDIFVPPPLAASFAHGKSHTVSGKAIRRKAKNGKTGWRAVEIESVSVDHAELQEWDLDSIPF